MSGMSRTWPDLDVSRESFLGGLGCFDCVNETKLGDRIGLAFSETMPVELLSKSHIKVIPGKLITANDHLSSAS